LNQSGVFSGIKKEEGVGSLLMASLIRMPQEESEVSDSVAPPYPLEKLVAYVSVGRIPQMSYLLQISS
jgi:hypothetical protein